MSERNSVDSTYYQKNREVILNRTKDYYEKDKEMLRGQARDKYRNLSEEEKNIIMNKIVYAVVFSYTHFNK